MIAPSITTDSVIDAIGKGHDTSTKLRLYFSQIAELSYAEVRDIAYLLMLLTKDYQLHCIDGVYFTDKHEALAALEESCRRNP